MRGARQAHNRIPWKWLVCVSACILIITAVLLKLPDALDHGGGEPFQSLAADQAAGAVASAMTALAPRTDSHKHWTEIPIVAHALGTVDGRRETNSLEAFLQSYLEGQRVFEVDLQLTSDGKLVARHDWDQISYYNLEQKYVGVMDWDTFVNTPICFHYTPLDIQRLLTLMRVYPDCYLVTDSKDTGEADVRAQMQVLAQAVEETGDPSLWDRIIIQIYHQEMYGWVKEEVPAVNWIFTLYQIANPDYHEIGSFCQERDIPVVTMDFSRISQENSEILRQYGCKIYLHTVNRLLDMISTSWGADGYYSDYVTPEQWSAVLSDAGAAS